VCFIFTSRRKLPVLFSTLMQHLWSPLIESWLLSASVWSETFIVAQLLYSLFLCVLCFTLFVKRCVCQCLIKNYLIDWLKKKKKNYILVHNNFLCFTGLSFKPWKRELSGSRNLHSIKEVDGPTQLKGSVKEPISSTSMKLRKSLVKPVTRQNISSCSILSPWDHRALCI